MTDINHSSAFDRVLEAARATTRRVVLPEANDPRVLAAAIEANQRRIASPILLGNASELHAMACNLNLSLNNIDIVDPKTFTRRPHYIDTLLSKQTGRRWSPEKADKALQDPIALACMMVSEGDADACVAGASTPTAYVVRNAIRYVGIRPGETLLSSCFIMLLRPEHPVQDLMLIGDCALVIDPNAEQLAAIAIATGDTAQQLTGLNPEVAMLSFSTDRSARHASVSKVRQATQLAREQRENWRFVGEVQLDAAVLPELLARKAPEQASDAPCNILIFPDLNAGNIGYKLLERFGGAQAIGPILQGLLKPVNDLSRGCNTQDIVNIMAVSAAQARNSNAE